VFLCFTTDTFSRKIKKIKNKVEEAQIVLYDGQQPSGQNTEFVQYFDAAVVKQIKSVGANSPPVKSSDAFPLDCPVGTDLLIESVNLIHRLSGYLDNKAMADEVKASMDDASHKPSLWGAISFVMGSAADHKSKVFHQMFEICGKCGAKTIRAVIDRDAQGSIGIMNSIWTTRVRVTRVESPAGDTCAATSTNWMHTKVPNGWVTSDSNGAVPANGLTKTFDNLSVLLTNFAKRYWRYNGLTNCQHFATNMFNEVAGTKLDIFSSNLMLGVHSAASGLLPAIDWDVKTGTPVKEGEKLVKAAPAVGAALQAAGLGVPAVPAGGANGVGLNAAVQAAGLGVPAAAAVKKSYRHSSTIY